MVGLSGSGGLRFGATCMAALSGSGVEFSATALRTYPTTKIAATDNDLIRLFRRMLTAKPRAMTAVTSVIICGSAILSSMQDFDDGAESKAGHYLIDLSPAGTPFKKSQKFLATIYARAGQPNLGVPRPRRDHPRNRRNRCSHANGRSSRSSGGGGPTVTGAALCSHQQ